MTRPLRIIGITAALLAGVSALGWRAGQQDALPAPPPPAAPEPWVPMPRSGMDASERNLRFAVASRIAEDDPTSLDSPVEAARATRAISIAST